MGQEGTQGAAPTAERADTYCQGTTAKAATALAYRKAQAMPIVIIATVALMVGKHRQAFEQEVAFHRQAVACSYSSLAYTEASLAAFARIACLAEREGTCLEGERSIRQALAAALKETCRIWQRESLQESRASWVFTAEDQPRLLQTRAPK